MKEKSFSGCLPGGVRTEVALQYQPNPGQVSRSGSKGTSFGSPFMFFPCVSATPLLGETAMVNKNKEYFARVKSNLEYNILQE